MFSTSRTTPTTTLFAEYQQPFLSNPGFWNVVLIVGGLLVALGILASKGNMILKIPRLLFALLGWLFLWSFKCFSGRCLVEQQSRS